VAVRTGIVALVQLIKHACRILTKFRPAIDQVIAAAVTGGVITSIQQGVLKTWLDGAQVACDILRQVTGY
jgi:hypothetical protein